MAKRALALFAAAFLATLIATAPATLLDGLLRHATKSRLALADAEGFIWRGAATLAVRGENNTYRALRPVRWDIEILPFFTGALKAHLQWDDSPPAEITVTPSEIELRHVDVTLPAEMLGQFSPLINTAKLQGQLTVHSDQMAIGRKAIEGNALIDWKQASSGLSRANPLGDYRISLSGRGAGLDIALATTSGILLLDGTGSFTGGRLAFHGTARAAAGNYDSLSGLLHSLGPETVPQVHGFNILPD